MLALFLTAAFIAGSAEASLPFHVDPKSSECLYVAAVAGKPVEGKFEVTRGGLLDIKLRISDPFGGLVTERLSFFNHDDDMKNEMEGVISFMPTVTGPHSICFDNSMSRWTPKVIDVTFAFHRPDENKVPGLQETGPQKAEIEPVKAQLKRLEKSVSKISTLQHKMRVHEQAHRDTVETVNARVVWLAIFESLVLLTITILQIYFISSWFSDSPSSGGSV
jgi:hypothetical protein